MMSIYPMMTTLPTAAQKFQSHYFAFCNRIKNFVNEDSLKQPYFAIVHSHLFYCLNVYSCANSTALQKLSLKQKETIRVINLAGYRDHTKPLFQKCKILLWMNLSNFKFMHSFIHNRLPFSFNETWIFHHVRTLSELYVMQTICMYSLYIHVAVSGMTRISENLIHRKKCIANNLKKRCYLTWPGKMDYPTNMYLLML